MSLLSEIKVGLLHLSWFMATLVYDTLFVTSEMHDIVGVRMSKDVMW